MTRPVDLTPAEVLAERHPHGTRVRYVAGRCRCQPCKDANTAYEVARAAARRRGDWNGLVPAETARRHLLALRRRGVGRRSVAAACDVPASILNAILHRRRLRIRARTERKILNVDTGARGDASLVPAGKTWRLIAELLEEGYTQRELSRRLGLKHHALQIGRERVTARTEMRVERLSRKAME